MSQKEADKRYREKHPDRVRAKDIVQNSKREDRKYGRGECTITKQWILDNIFTSKCYYCGETDWRKLGCDRIDNTKPHTPENVVCSCKSCNEKRHNMPFEEFVTECKKARKIITQHNPPEKSKPIKAVNSTGEVVFIFPSISEAARNGFNKGNVWCACNNRYKREGNNFYKGLYWSYME